jgi:hypothetical protein
MNDIAVVFDTNAYRDLQLALPGAGIASMPVLRAKEAQNRITAYANPYVIMELASHLWDANDPNYAECRQGLCCLYEHCRTDGGAQLRLVADSESLLAHMLYQRVPAGSQETTERLSRLAYAVGVAPAGELPQGIRDACKNIADQLAGRESLFVGDMATVVQSMNPGCAGWVPFAKDQSQRAEALAVVRSKDMPYRIAVAYVLRVRNLLGLAGNAPDLKGMADAVLDHAPAPIALYGQILERLVNTGCNLTKRQRANWIWDMEIAVGIGEAFGHPAQRMTLVTGDHAIVGAAKAASLGQYVRVLHDYLASTNT